MRQRMYKNIIVQLVRLNYSGRTHTNIRNYRFPIPLLNIKENNSLLQFKKTTNGRQAA